MAIRLRVPELLRARRMTAYALAKAVDGTVSRSMVYRIAASGGEFRCLSPEQIDGLCRAFRCEPKDLFKRS
jgi:DNA-binding Xre family transcriptional regulator